jgi:hypothetical protein
VGRADGSFVVCGVRVGKVDDSVGAGRNACMLVFPAAHRSVVSPPEPDDLRQLHAFFFADLRSEQRAGPRGCTGTARYTHDRAEAGSAGCGGCTQHQVQRGALAYSHRLLLDLNDSLLVGLCELLVHHACIIGLHGSACLGAPMPPLRALVCLPG